MLVLYRTLLETLKCRTFYFVGARSLLLNSFSANGSKCFVINSVGIYRHLFCSPSSLKRLGSVDAEKQNKPGEDKRSSKPKKEKQIYVTLIGTDNNITVATLEEAKKLADRRNLKLVKVKDFDTKTSRPEYKLMTSAQYLEEDKKHREEIKQKKGPGLKGDKIATISYKINEHDLNSKIKMMKKWLEKNYEVRIVITGDSGDSGENVYKAIEKEVKAEGKIVQKRVKSTDIRFQILPLKKTDSVPKSDSTHCETKDAGK